MAHLSQADQSAVLDALRELYAELELGPLRELMVRLASRLVSNEWASYNEVTKHEHRSLLNFRIPDSVEVQTHAPSLLACIHEHPVVKFESNRPFEARAISDFMPQREFRRTTMFNEYYRHVGVRHQIFFSFDGGRGTRRIIAINRKHRGFSERDRAVLNLLSPHFGQAYENAVRVQRLHPAVSEPQPATTTAGSTLPELTPRENEVLDWIARGKSNPEIATILGLSVRTIYKHVENIFAKLGLESRAQAMVRVLGARR
jgi:DNA-binding CsgD family transcriptional regulator